MGSSRKKQLTKPTPIIADPRFSNIHTDPRFRLPSKKRSHIKLDKRFAHVLDDEDFSRKGKVDRYGRKTDKLAGRNHLKHLYRLETDDIDNDQNDKRTDEGSDQDRPYDPARDGGFSTSSEESDSDADEDGPSQDALASQTAAELDVPVGSATSRLAAVNLDWDHIKAVDLMALASSFTPSEGRILNVSIYPSEFGKSRIEREEIEGPPSEIFNTKTIQKDDGAMIDSQNSEDEEEAIKQNLLSENKGEEFDSTALRSYQLERLRYYYAVISCSDIATAQSLYDSMDGREYLSTANFMDLRFIPDETSFDEDTPRDVCNQVPQGYHPNDFVTDALTHSKVKLTWDAEDSTRKEAQKRAFSRADMDENDLKAYIGTDSSGSDSESEGDNGLDKVSDKAASLRAALGLSSSGSTKSTNKKSRPKADSLGVGDMEVTFHPGLSGAATSGDVFENDHVLEESTKDKYIRKEKERKARRKEKAKAAREHLEDAEEKQYPASADSATLTKQVMGFAQSHSSTGAKNLGGGNDGAAKRRRELELLVAGDTAHDVRHFDLKDIIKAEKEPRKRKGRNNPSEEGGGDSNKHQTGFTMDMEDPRFAMLWDNHEYAIDPTNPRFQATKGMNSILKARKKRRGNDDLDYAERVPKRKNINTTENVTSKEDLKRLVDRIKKGI